MTSTARNSATRHLFKPSHTSSVGKVSFWIALPLAVLFLLPAYAKLLKVHASPIAAIAILAGSVLLVLGSIWILMRVWRATTALQVGDGRLVYESWGRRRSWPLSKIARLVRGNVTLVNVRSPSYTGEQLMFIDHSGRCFLRLGPNWAHTPIGHVIGVPIEPKAVDVVTAGDAARAFPGSYAWPTAHPWGRFGLSIAAGTVLFWLLMAVIALRG
jgi:hypothetical protein